MVAQLQAPRPEQKPRRERRIKYLAQRRKLRKIERKLRPVTFDNHTVTEATNFQYLEVFKQLISLPEMISTHLEVDRAANCLYTSQELVDFLIDCVLLGHTRFSHMCALQSDPGYKIVKEIDPFPDESTFRNFLTQLTEEHVPCFIALNKALLHSKASMESDKRLIWIDINDTVITLFGEQEGATNGYNPRYHGRPSFKARVAFISGTGELLHLELSAGNNHGMKDFLSFIKEIEAMLPSQYIIQGIRADCGFADPTVMEYAEEKGWEYIFKLPKKATVKKAISYLQDQPCYWETLSKQEEEIHFASEDDRWAAADIPILLTNWEKDRRCVIYREAHETEQTTDDQITMTLTTYTFQAIITNTELKPLPLLRSYNKRVNVENRIDELKDGYALEQNSQHALFKNRLFAWIKVISYNLLTWFKQALLPETLQRCEVKTIRRIIIKVPRNIVGSGRYQHIRLAPNKQLEEILLTMCRKLAELTKQLITNKLEAA